MKTSKQLLVSGLTCLLVFTKIVAFAFNNSTNDSQSGYPISALTIVECPLSVVAHCGQASDPYDIANYLGDAYAWPWTDGNPISPDYACYHASYTDQVLNDCGNGEKITRTWTITNTCGEPFTQCVQILKFSDDEAPELDCPDDVEVSCATDPSEFSEDPEVFDACGSSYTVEYDDSPYLPCTGNGYTITRVYTVTDACGNANSCAMSITILCRPTIQAYSIYFPTVNSTSLEVEWYPGNGSSRIVVMNTVNSFSLPPDGYDPLPNTVYDGSGEQVIYNGLGESVIVTGLSPNTTYWFRVFEASDCSGENKYLTTMVTGNPKSQKTSGSISTYMVQTRTPFKVPGHSNPSLLASGTTDHAAPVIKICADGSSATIVKFTIQDPNINPNSIRFAMESDPTGANPMLFGRFSPSDYSVVGNTVTVLFTHPEFLPDNYTEPFRPDQINIVTTVNPSSPIYIIPVKIYRAPIVFVHGWTGTSETFEKMNYDLVKSNHYVFPLTTKVYYSTSLESFAANSGVVRDWITTAFDISLKGKFSAGQVDVVGHSMGGILTRLYQQNNYGNKYRDDINKIITLNTPHSGSYLANAVTLLSLPFSAPFCGANQLFGTQHWICSGATLNMQTYSAPIDKVLNGAQSLAVNHVPSHTITSTILLNPPSNYSQEPISLAGSLLSSLLKAYKKIIGVLFDDGVVTLSAQTGGLIGNKTSNPGMHFHIGTASEPIFIDKVKELLCENPFSGSFELNGFNPPNLPILPPTPIKVQIADQQIGRERVNLKILAPLEGSTHFSGGLIDVQSEFDTAISSIQYVVGNSVIGYAFLDSVVMSSPAEVQYTIPIEAVGKITIGVIGFNSNGSAIASDSVSINVEVESNLESLEIYPDAILIGSELQRDFAVFGHYADSVTRNITHLSAASIKDSSIAKVVSKGRIEGVSIDSTILTVNYSGLIDSANIYVFQGDSLRHALFDSDKSVICDSGVINFNNVSTGHATSFLWNFQGGEPSTSTDINPTVHYSENGEFSVSLIANYPNYSDTLMIPGYTTVTPNPVIELSHVGNISLCEGSELFLSVSSQLNDHFYWSNDSTSQSIAVNEPGDYFLYAFNSFGCYSLSDTIHVMEYPNPIPIIEGDPRFCPGNSTTLFVDSIYTQINWSTGQTGNEIQVSESGPITVSVIDSNGCSGTSSEFFLIPFDTIEAEIITLGLTSFCIGDSVLLMTNKSSSYVWSQGDTGQVIVVHDSGLYTVTVIDTNGCQSVSPPVLISVHELPSVNIGADTAVTSASFILDAGPNGTNYEWSTGDTTQIIVVTTTGEYRITITDSNGCQASDTINVEFITGTFSFNEVYGIRVYPNPNHGVFRLEFSLSNPEKLRYDIYDPMGRLVASDLLESMAERVNTMVSIPNASSAIYYLRLRLGSNSYVIKLAVL